MTFLAPPSAARVRYLLKETVLFLIAAYVVLLGGTFNGLVLYRLNLTTTCIVAALGAAWVVWRWRRPFPATRLDGPIIALLGAYVVASALSLDPRRSAAATVIVLLYVLAFYLVVDLLRGGWPAELLIKALLFAGSFILFFGLWEIQRWYSGWLAIGGWAQPLPPATLRIRAFLGHPNFVAPFFNVLLPLAVAQAIRARGIGRVGWAGWAAAALVLVFFTSSRAGWLGLAAGLTTLAALLIADRGTAWREVWQRWRYRRAAGVMGFVVGVPFLAGAGYVIYLQAQHPSHAGRDYIWRVAADMFLRRPLTGTGPWTYGTEFIAAYSVPPAVLLAHAHNYFLNTVAETGLLGGLALAAILTMGGLMAWRRWSSAGPGQRTELTGCLAALTGLGVNSLFDTPQTFPAITLMAVVVAALLAAGDMVTQRAWAARLSRWLPALGVSLAVTALAWSLRAYAPFSRGVLAGALGDWATSATELSVAARLDPTNAFFWLQSGYAHGRVALDDMGHVVEQTEAAAAINDYQRGIALEPEFATNYANLGVLLLASGGGEAGIAALEEAVARAELEPGFRATLAKAYEAAGRTDAAAAEFQSALDLRPDWATAYFFRATPARQEALAEWQMQHPGGWRPGGAELAPGWDALAAGKPAQAMEAFQALTGLNRPEIYLGMGLAHLAQGRAPEAERALRTSLFVPGAAGQITAMTRFALGRSLAAQGRGAEAASAYEAGLALLDGTTSFGVGQLAASDYGWYVFHRESLPPDLLPGIEAFHYPASAVEAMVTLGDLAEQAGQPVSALAWFCRAAFAAPDHAAATARAAERGGCQP